MGPSKDTHGTPMPEKGGCGWPTTLSLDICAQPKKTSNRCLQKHSILALANAKLEVDRALRTANKTLHHLLEKFHLSLRQTPKPQNSTASKTRRVHTEVYESETDAKIHRGKWVVKTHKARYVLRGFEEKRAGRRSFRQHDDGISKNASFSKQQTSQTKAAQCFVHS